MAQREALGWSCNGLSVTVAVPIVPVLRHAQGIRIQAYFVLEVFFVCVWLAVAGGGREEGGIFKRTGAGEGVSVILFFQQFFVVKVLQIQFTETEFWIAVVQ